MIWNTISKCAAGWFFASKSAFATLAGALKDREMVFSYGDRFCGERGRGAGAFYLHVNSICFGADVVKKCIATKFISSLFCVGNNWFLDNSNSPECKHAHIGYSRWVWRHPTHLVRSPGTELRAKEP